MRLGLNATGLNQSNVFSPQSLFTAGEQGALFEAYNPDTLYRRINLLNYSEDVSNAVWAVEVGATKADGNVVNLPGTSDKFAQTLKTTSGASRSFTSATTVSARVTLSGTGTIRLWFYGTSGGGNTGVTQVTLSAQPTEFVITGTALNTALLYIGRLDGTDTATAVTFHRAHVNLGATVTDYQKVTDWTTEYLATASTNIGMYQDSAGTTPVTAVEQPVGLWLDTKQGRMSGSEMWNDGSVTFSGSESSRVSAGVYRIYSSAGSYSGAFINSGLTAGRVYEVTLTVDNITTLGAGVTLEGFNSPPVFTTTGAKRAIVSATGAAYGVKRQASACDIQVSGLSVRELPGNHATQATSASRPTLSARYNLLAKTEQLSAWTATASGTGVAPIVTDNYAAAPDGSMTAARVQLNAGAGNTATDISWVATTAGSAGIGAGLGRGRVFMRTTDGSAKTVIYRPCTGTRNQVALTGVWQEVTFTGGDTQNFQILTYGDIGDDVADILVWHPDFRTNDDAAKNIPAYQRVNTATDYDTAGFLHYLKFDGVDDSLSTGSIDFSATDKMTVWAGVTKLSDAASGVVTELTTNIAVNAGGFVLTAPPGAASARYSWKPRGSIEPTASASSTAAFAAPVSTVLAASGDIAGDSAALRAGGAVTGSLSEDMGTGGFANAPLYIGRRGGTTLPFNGRITALAVRGATTTAPTNARMEQWCAAKNGQSFAST